MRRGPDAASPYRYVGATARSAADGWESLGDIGKVDADGYVYITDRLADMILVGGANVYPAGRGGQRGTRRDRGRAGRAPGGAVLLRDRPARRGPGQHPPRHRRAGRSRSR